MINNGDMKIPMNDDNMKMFTFPNRNEDDGKKKKKRKNGFQRQIRRTAGKIKRGVIHP